MKPLLVSIIIFLTQSVVAQDTCKEHWKYLSLKETIEGKVIFFQQPYGECGTISLASNAVIITNKGDTIRVLQLCDNKEMDSADRLRLGDYVIAKPDGTLSETPGPLCDPFACIFQDTYWGEIIKKK